MDEKTQLCMWAVNHAVSLVLADKLLLDHIPSFTQLTVKLIECTDQEFAENASNG